MKRQLPFGLHTLLLRTGTINFIFVCMALCICHPEPFCGEGFLRYRHRKDSSVALQPQNDMAGICARNLFIF